jgi:hypothetical protein
MKRLLACVFALCSVLFFSSWGFLVHRTATQVAVYQLPKSIQPFFYRNMDYLVKNSVRPDQRRNTDKTEDTKHFIDFEAFGDSAAWKMPADWSRAVKLYTKDSLLKYGYVPYWIMVMKEKLTDAFRSRNKDSILFYAADISHYIGDLHVPLHTSLNYDGQLTNQKGLHSLWESMIPEIEIENYRLYNNHKARYLAKPEKEVWAAARKAHSLLTDVFQKEREASKKFTDSTKYRWQKRNGRDVRSYTSAFAKAYSKELGNSINKQLLRSSNLIADIWYTCWVDAGRPDLSKLHQLSDKDKEQLKTEQKSFKKNKLIKDNLLIAKQKKEGDD